MEHRELTRKQIIIILAIGIIIILAIVCSIARTKKQTIEPETIIESEHETQEEIASPSEVDLPKTILNVFESDIESIKAGGTETIQRYFGESTGLTKDKSNKIFSHLKINVIKETEESIDIEVHTVNWERIYADTQIYSKQVKDSNVGISDHDLESYVSSYITEQINSGVYDINFEISIRFMADTNLIEITENLKRALTGNWYYSLDCDIEPILEIIE